MRSESPAERVGANVRAEMARRGLNQRSIAPCINLSQQALSRRLNGQTAFNVDELDRIADCLSVTVASLIAPAVAAPAGDVA
jgi:transcriptional regulator with XRE-family HTH domain